MTAKTAAQRASDHRRRKRQGSALLTVEADPGAVADYLVEAGLLGEWDTENRLEVAAALSRLLFKLTA